jgi:hypothetical protein
LRPRYLRWSIIDIADSVLFAKVMMDASLQI